MKEERVKMRIGREKTLRFILSVRCFSWSVECEREFNVIIAHKTVNNNNFHAVGVIIFFFGALCFYVNAQSSL